MMLVSVIIPVYNVAPYVEQCIQSVINQTYTNLEVIIVDDCGTDNSMEIVERTLAASGYKICADGRYKTDQSHHSFHIIHHKQNQGLSAARNTGIHAANGEFVGFIDSDDWVEPTMYEDLAKVLDSDSSIAFVTTPAIGETGKKAKYYFDRTSKYQNYHFCTPNDFLAMMMARDIDSYAWNKLFRKEYIKTQFPIGRNCEDYTFHYYNCKSISSTNLRIHFSQNHYYHYRQREGSIMHSHLLATTPWYIDFFKNMLEVIDDTKCWNESLHSIQIRTLAEVAGRHFYNIVFNKNVINSHQPLLQDLRPYLCYVERKNRSLSFRIELKTAAIFRNGFAYVHYYRATRNGISSFIRKIRQ